MAAFEMGGLKMVITRGSILREALIEKEDMMYRYSKFRAGLTALEG